MSSCQSAYGIALKINDVLTRIQSELKCGVCRSTFFAPVVATCGHTFCKQCLDQVFHHRRSVECPICRKGIKKRSCTPSEQQDTIVKGYLQLGRIFRLELQNQTFSIPKDLAYMESQMVPTVAALGDSPIRDFRPQPCFALPKARARRKKPLRANVETKFLKMDTITEENEGKENASIPKLTKPQDIKANTLSRRSEADLVQYLTTKSIDIQCCLPDPHCVCRNLRDSLRVFKESCIVSKYPSDLHALFALVPEYKELLGENLSVLYELLPPLTTKKLEHVASTGSPKQELAEFKLRKKRTEALPLDDACCGEMMETHSNPFISELVPSSAKIDDVENNDKLSLSSSKPSSEIVPQSPNASDGEMDITLQAVFESFPEDSPHSRVSKVTSNTSSSIVVSVSRLSCLDDEKLVTKFLTLFPDVGFNEEVASTSTHLVMMNSREQTCQQRSLRYVYAVAHKCELVNRCWLEECIQFKRLLPTTQYNLTSHSKPGTPGWVRSRACSAQLFEQMKFFLPHTFSHSQCLPRHKLKELINICGGSCYDKPWEMAGAQNALTIFSPKSCEWDAAQRYEASMEGIPVLVADWVLDSIAEFRLMPLDPYRVQQK